MSRALNAFFEAALASDTFEPFFAVDLYFDSPHEVFLWTGQGSIEINGKTYLGGGELLGISEIAESAEVEALGANVTLSGMPPELIAKALATPYQGRDATIYFGLMADPSAMLEMFSGFIDTMPIEEGPEGAQIQISIENKLIDLERPRVAKFTAAHQEARYPGDKGLGYVASLQDQKLPWGKGVR